MERRDKGGESDQSRALSGDNEAEPGRGLLLDHIMSSGCVHL